VSSTRVGDASGDELLSDRVLDGGAMLGAIRRHRLHAQLD
jgi:hypothetical protein